MANSRLIVKAVNSYEANQALIASLTEALEQQGDNMAFVLNHVGLPDQWYEKFTRELAEIRAALSLAKSETPQ
jgi:hypothetical protein